MHGQVSSICLQILWPTHMRRAPNTEVNNRMSLSGSLTWHKQTECLQYRSSPKMFRITL